MKLNKLLLGIAVAMVLIMVSCNTPRYIYSPSAHNVPVLTQKGDSKIGAVYSTNFTGEEKRDGALIDNRSRGYDLHGAAAITDHFAVQASYFYRWEKSSGGKDSLTVRYKRNLTEIGLGYYLPVNDKKNVIFQFLEGQALASLVLPITQNPAIIFMKLILQKYTCSLHFFSEAKEASLRLFL